MVGSTVVALAWGERDPGSVYNGSLAGLVAVRAGSDLMHPLGALSTGGIAAGVFVQVCTLTQSRRKIGDVLSVWSLYGLCDAWVGIATGIFDLKALGGLGGVSIQLQLAGAPLGAGAATLGERFDQTDTSTQRQYCQSQHGSDLAGVQ